MEEFLMEKGNVVFAGDNFEGKPVIDFGQQFTSLSNIKQEDVEFMVKGAADNLKNALSYISDMEWIGEPEIFTNIADPLGRFSTSGYRIQGASVGYKVLENHFQCHKEHVPYEITIEFINQMIERYVRQERDED
jgi:hypothetical protein